MEFNPDDAGDRGSFTLLPEGLYDIEVVDAEERTSQKGNQMIALTIEAKHPDGYPSRVWDYLVSTPAAVFKIKQFCDAAGLDKEFTAGTLKESHCRGRRLKAKIFIESGREGYQDRNAIREYVHTSDIGGGGISTMPEQTMAAAPAQAAPVTEDEIPF
ncbi:MAG: DUF669 domain-containing protein [Phycisphaerales bacterium]|nr:DUF669 domain-containing protein [Phycisphaerales bacterium]